MPARFLRGEAPGPPPDLTDWERPLFEQASRQLPAVFPATVRTDRDWPTVTTRVGGGAITVAVPGTPPAASRSPFPRAVSCSQATPQPAALPARSCPACSTTTAPRPPRPSRGCRPGHRHRLLRPRRAPHPERGTRTPEGRQAARRSPAVEIAAGRARGYALPKYAIPPVALRGSLQPADAQQ